MKQPEKEKTSPIEWTIDFEWSRCIDGYRLETWDGAPEGTFEGRRRRSGGWYRVYKSATPGAWIENVSARYERYRPLDIPALFVRFAKDTPASAKGMLEFCNRFGIPGSVRADGPRRGDVTREGINVGVLLEHQAKMRHAFNLFEARDSKALLLAFNASDGTSLARIELRQAEDGRLHWCHVPPDLIRAMWLQFAMYASSETKLFRCQRCNEPFVVGTHTGRRSTAVYCSNACKVAAFKERHG
jgi:hypothetical protein